MSAAHFKALPGDTSVIFEGRFVCRAIGTAQWRDQQYQP